MVMEHGVCLLTNVPCTDEGGYEVNPVIQGMYIYALVSLCPSVMQITNKVSPYLQETFYGGVYTCIIIYNIHLLSNTCFYLSL